MLTFLKRYQKRLIILIFPYLYMLFLLVAPTNKLVVAPGDLTPVNESIIIDGITMVDQFHTIYVYSYYPMTPFQTFVTSGDDRMAIYPMSTRQKDTSWRDDYLSGQVSKLSSLHISVIQAYELAGNVDPTITIDYYFAGLMVSYRPSRINDLNIGDRVIAINGISYEGLDEESFLSLSEAKEVTLLIQRGEDGNITTHSINYTLEDDEPALRFYPYYHIDQATPTFTLPGLESVIGGPSGGMIQTLSLYASLLKLNIGDLKIAGTGTIEMSGNIGKIGGIRQKIYTAKDQKVDIFFIPSEHFSEIQGIEYSFVLYVVSTIEEAVQALHEVID